MAYETTTVPVERSQAQLRKLLQAYGADSFEFGEGRLNGQRMAAIAFAVHGQRVRIRVPFKEADDDAVRAAASRSRRSVDETRITLSEREDKRIWRVLSWNVKARLEAVEEGIETFEEAFLAHLLNESTGQTIFEQLAETGQVQLDRPLLALSSGVA
jgi:hypothetical protein